MFTEIIYEAMSGWVSVFYEVAIELRAKVFDYLEMPVF